jgi:hypothetical protein
MNKHKIGDDVEVVSRLDGLAIGQIVTVVGHYESMSGKLDGVVVRVGDGPGLYTCHQSHVKPVPPKPPVPGELWVNVYGNGLGAADNCGHRTKESADIHKSQTRIGGKAWRYVLAEGQE